MEHDFEFRSERLVFRGLVAEDVHHLFTLEVELATGQDHCPSKAELDALLLSQRADHVTLNFVGCHGGAFAAHVSLRQEVAAGTWRLGYAVSASMRRLGLGREAVHAVMAFSRSRLGCETFVARVEPSNAASIALLRGLGFELVARQSLPRQRLIFRSSFAQAAGSAQQPE